MASDEADSVALHNFQKQVLSDFEDHLRQRKGGLHDPEVKQRERELERAALEWCEENGVKPEHLENSLARYSMNFSPGADARPLDIAE